MAFKRKQHVKKTRRPRRIPKGVLGKIALVMLVLLACVVPVVFVASPISYIPLVAVVVFIGVSYAYLRILMRSLEYSEASLLKSCERGSEIEFVVNFKNTSPLVFVRLEPYFYISDLFGNVDVDMPASMTLMPHEVRDFNFQASFDHIGTYSAGVSKIVISDLIGLFTHTIVNPNRHQVDVLPRVFNVDEVHLESLSVQESNKAYQPIVTDDMDYAGVRGYAPGDPLKTIHWKLSSRNPDGEYFTRLFEAFGNPGLSIIIDHEAPDYDSESLMQVFDGVVESALSVALRARELGIDASVMFNDKYGEFRRVHVTKVEDSAALIAGIPRIAVGSGDMGAELLEREGKSIHGEGNVAFCTAHVTQQVVSTLCDIKLAKRNPLLFVVVPSELSAKERTEYLRPLRRLDNARVGYYVVEGAR